MLIYKFPLIDTLKGREDLVSLAKKFEIQEMNCFSPFELPQ